MKNKDFQIWEPKRFNLSEIFKEALLREGLIKTYSVDDTLNMLHNLNINKDNIRVINDNNTTKFYVFIENNRDYFNKLNQKFDLCGWFLSDAQTEDDYYKNIKDVFNLKDRYIWVSFSAKFDINIL